MMVTAEPTRGVVEVVQGQHVVAEISVGQSGQFSLDLPPGDYSLTGESLYFWSGDPGVARLQGRCASQHPVRIRTGELVSLDVDCHLLPGDVPG